LMVVAKILRFIGRIGKFLLHRGLRCSTIHELLMLTKINCVAAIRGWKVKNRK
jgi:hypothetical protein